MQYAAPETHGHGGFTYEKCVINAQNKYEKCEILHINFVFYMQEKGGYMDERGYHDEAEGWDPAGNWCGECLRATCQDCIVWLLKKYNGVTDYPLAPYEKAIVKKYKAEQEYHIKRRP